MGYVGTTGLSAIDYLLADKYHIRAGEENDYVERVLRMPHGYVCYSPIFDTPEPAPLPALQRGFVTFGCFNNPTKYTPSTLNAWAEIQRRVPQARLFLKFGGLQHAEIQNRIRSQFAEHGIQPDRLAFEGWSAVYENLASYQRVDIALDTQPYSGCVTTCEALWMGVPVITWPGMTFAGRQSTSHLRNAGYPQFVADDAQGYVELAVEWSRRLDELAAIRRQMRERMRGSPLCDAARFASDFLEVLRLA